MATTRRQAAPNPEWVLMYRGGLSRTQMSALTGTPASTVGYHLRVGCAADPWLREAHQVDVGNTSSRVTARGLTSVLAVFTNAFPSFRLVVQSHVHGPFSSAPPFGTPFGSSRRLCRRSVQSEHQKHKNQKRREWCEGSHNLPPLGGLRMDDHVDAAHSVM